MNKFLPNPDTYIQGNVERLVQVANVEGDLVIVAESAGLRAIKTLGDETRNHWEKREYAQLTPLFEDTTNLINITVRSQRFGKKVKLKVPADMRVWAFLNILVNTLGLPQRKTVDELGISFAFVYTLQSEVPLETNKTLRESGITDGAELQLLIDVAVADPFVEEMESELDRMYSTVFMITPEGWCDRMRDLENEVTARRQKLHERYASDILREPWFEYLRT